MSNELDFRLDGFEPVDADSDAQRPSPRRSM